MKKDTFTNNNQTLNRALFTPSNATKDDGKNPLIIWLHGLGEGGDDIDIFLLGNEVTALCKDEIQSYFIMPLLPLWHLTVQSAVATVTVLRSTMTTPFCLYNFRIISLKSVILLRELSLNLLIFPYFVL